MGKIIILDENTSNKIAAGEVIERPASVVKELVENAIDAGADRIQVEIKNGGISFIKVSDNGHGIAEDDVEIAFERHSTSKIRRPDDLLSISTLGFRGEALASIAAVSTVQLASRVKDSSYGMQVEVTGGNIVDVKQTGCPVGTTFIVRNLFFNTPARYKFLKKDSTETGYISDILGRIALGRPEISFKLTSGASVLLHTPGNGDLKSVIFSVYGRDTASRLHEVDYADNAAAIRGCIGKPEIARSNRNHQSLYINGRYVRSRLVSSAVEEAYKTYLMKEKHPFYVLNLALNPMLVDVNVHPAKMEIRFSNEQEIFSSIYNAVNSTLIKSTTIMEQKDAFSPVAKASYGTERNAYKQQDFAFTDKAGDYRGKEPLQEESKLVRETIGGWAEGFAAETGAEEAADVHVAEFFEKERRISPSAKIVGQLFSTYILIQQNDELIMIDQHAAHERVMYEKLLESYNRKSAMGQLLVSPVSVQLTHKEFTWAIEHKDFFENIGFKFESFGNNSVMLRSVPYTNHEVDSRRLFMELVDKGLSNENRNTPVVADEILYTVACKAAIKANRTLGEPEIRSLLEKLSVLVNPFSCPHGRPTAVKITRRDIEKMFKRIV